MRGGRLGYRRGSKDSSAGRRRLTGKVKRDVAVIQQADKEEGR